MTGYTGRPAGRLPTSRSTVVSKDLNSIGWDFCRESIKSSEYNRFSDIERALGPLKGVDLKIVPSPITCRSATDACAARRVKIQ